MLKGILVGLMAGALATAGVLKALAAHRQDAAQAAGSAAAAPDPAALKTEADGLKTGNAALQKSIDDRKAELASIEKKQAAGDGKKKKRKAGEKSWKELAPLLVKAFGNGEPGDEKDKKAAQEAQLDFFALVARIAKQHGIAIDDAMTAPEGLPQLLKALLETGDPPGTPEQLARVDALIASYTKDWNKIHDPAGDMTNLEQKLATVDLSDAYVAGMLDTMTAEQKASNKDFEMFSMMSEGMGGSNHWSTGTRDTVAQDITADWSKSLKLDDVQKVQIGKFVEQYMKDYSDVSTKYQSEMQSGDRAIWKKIQREQVEAMIKIQQSIASSMSLSPDQAKALRNWATTYNFNIQDPPKDPGDPAPAEK
jgi:hypothetical protein